MQSKRLFFLLNFDKQFSRQIQTIEYLSSLKTPISINDLSIKIGCSMPTMRSDINALNNELPNTVQIEAQGKDGYVLRAPDGISMPSIIMDLAKETDVFRIIDSLFNNQVYTFDEMVSELFINPCTLRNILAHINSIIKQFNISISTSPVTFIGSETDIRLFFYKFYYDFNDYYTVDPEFNKNYNAYISIISDSKESITPRIHVSHFRATLWIMIIRQRIQAKLYVELDDAFKHQIMANEDFECFKQSFTAAFASSFYIYKPPLDDIIWAYVALLHCISYSEPSRNLFTDDKYEYVLHRCVSQDLIDRVNDFLALEFDMETVKSPYLDKMRAYLINLSMLTNLSPQFQSLSVTTRLFVTESLNEYYMIWMKNLYSKEGQALFPIICRDDIALALAMLYYSVLSNLRKHDIRILFCFQGGVGYDDFLVQQTRSMIPQNVVPFYVFDQIITEDIFKKTNADLVVVNYDSPEFNNLSTRVIHFSYIPTMSEWSTLSNIILSLSTTDKYA